MKGLDLVLAAVGGAVVGAAVALLFAPQKGEDTRETIKDFIKDHFPGIKTDKLDRLAEQISEEIKEVKL